ncbi:MAG: helix-turn-helix transcriptional regulator [Acidobacteria bacterium]|nr:helix-turn-helix transcriptional regulator [Acidobacteriota bacterium]
MSDLSQNGLPGGEKTLNGTPAPLARQDSDYLRLLGESVRSARTHKGMTRKMLAANSGVSERFLAQLENGTGNASILVLRQIAEALDLPVETLLPDGNARSSDLLAATELLRSLSDLELARAHESLRAQFHLATGQREHRIALIGLRGAGKSSVGAALAKALEVPFFELDRLIEQESGVSLSMIFDMYGQNEFRRYERRCLESLLSRHQRFVLATGGSLVSEAATYDRLLAACYTIWLRATPQEHMSRVVAQGDMRPMAHNPQAMSDLERILEERNHLYAKADAIVNTSGRSIEEVTQQCLASVSVREPVRS